MKAIIETEMGRFEVDFSLPIDLSIPVSREHSPEAFYLGKPRFETVIAGDFTGSVEKGGSCNCETITLAPHGNGTHTEGIGHIATGKVSVDDVVSKSIFIARLITVTPSGKTIPGNAIRFDEKVDALIVRTVPNTEEKKTRNYSGTDPVYFSAGAIEEINNKRISHLLTDLPSIDKEDDDKLVAHHSFFGESRSKTVTELIYVPDEAEDGIYLLDLQVAPIESDAAPSRPVIYRMRVVLT